MQNQQQKIEDPGFALSFSVYSLDTITSTAVAKVIREEATAWFHQNDGEDFEFALGSSDEEGSVKETKPQGLIASKRDLLVNDPKIRGPLGKLFIKEPEDSFSYLSLKPADKLESPPFGTKGKKSSSTRSRSKRWIFQYLVHQSNSEGKGQKHERNSGEVSKVGGPWKAHEQFYVQKRAENEGRKKRSYLPYRTDIVGLFANVNVMGKMLSF